MTFIPSRPFSPSKSAARDGAGAARESPARSRAAIGRDRRYLRFGIPSRSGYPRQTPDRTTNAVSDRRMIDDCSAEQQRTAAAALTRAAARSRDRR
jgi:hypothetical protein